MLVCTERLKSSHLFQMTLSRTITGNSMGLLLASALVAVFGEWQFREHAHVRACHNFLVCAKAGAHKFGKYLYVIRVTTHSRLPIRVRTAWWRSQASVPSIHIGVQRIPETSEFCHKEVCAIETHQNPMTESPIPIKIHKNLLRFSQCLDIRIHKNASETIRIVRNA